MASNSSQLSRILARTAGQGQFAALVFAGVAAFASVAPANPSEVAVVESISGNSSGVEFMDYLHLGQVIRLNNRETLVLSYKASCLRETITGGTVTVGLDVPANQCLAAEISGSPTINRSSSSALVFSIH